MPGYMSGSKSARGTPKIANKRNCGGPKKGGLAPRVGKTATVTHELRKRATTGPLVITLSNNCPDSFKNYRPVLPSVGKTSLLVMGMTATGR